LAAAHADEIEDAPIGKAWADRHANWGTAEPREVTDLGAFVAELDHDSRLALFAHCVVLTVNAVRLPCDRRPQAIATANRLAEAVSLDMAGYWLPTALSYLGRVTEVRMLEAVRERVSERLRSG
jgi:ParB family chromosome partitioning protein